MGYMLLLSRSDKVARFFSYFFWLGGLIGWVIVNAFFRGLIYLFYILTILPPVILAISYYLGGKLYLEEKTKQVRWTALTLLYCVLHLVNFFPPLPRPHTLTPFTKSISAKTLAWSMAELHVCEGFKKP
jgi:dolichyl-phosphate-mannose--protein O-mannosyl transferase